MNTSLQRQNPANKTCGACATLPHPPQYQNKGTQELVGSCHSKLHRGFYREFVLRNSKKPFPLVSISGFQISALPSLSSSGLLAVWSALFLFTLTSLFITRQDFFFKAHSGACLFFLKLYRDLSASFAASHPVFRQSSCLVKNNNFWMSLYVSCF